MREGVSAPRSHWETVVTLTPMAVANSAWVMRRLWRRVPTVDWAFLVIFGRLARCRVVSMPLVCRVCSPLSIKNYDN